MFGIKHKVAKTAKRAGLFSGGLLLCTVGTGFLTVAGWFALVPTVGVAATAAIIAGLYFGLGLILIGIGSGSTETPRHTEPAPPPQEPPLMQAFLYGLQAGSHADKSRQ